MQDNAARQCENALRRMRSSLTSVKRNTSLGTTSIHVNCLISIPHVFGLIYNDDEFRRPVATFLLAYHAF